MFFLKLLFEFHVETVYLNHLVGSLPHVVALPCVWLLSHPIFFLKLLSEVHVEIVYLSHFVGSPT
jgi:hypothetical protein